MPLLRSMVGFQLGAETQHTANKPARVAQLDDRNDRAILVQGDEGPAQVFSWGITALRQLFASDDGAISSPPAPYHLSVPRGIGFGFEASSFICRPEVFTFRCRTHPAGETEVRIHVPSAERPSLTES